MFIVEKIILIKKHTDMGRMKEEFMEMREQELNDNINQTNYKMSNNLTKTKMKKVENNTEVKIETKKEALRRLYIENGLTEKRAMSRVVLKIAGFYEQGVFGQDEIVD
jgi:hypothetical protein